MVSGQWGFKILRHRWLMLLFPNIFHVELGVCQKVLGMQANMVFQSLWCQLSDRLQVKPLPEHRFVFNGPVSRGAGSEKKASMEVDWKEFAPLDLKAIRVGPGKRKQPASDAGIDAKDGGEGPAAKAKGKAASKAKANLKPKAKKTSKAAASSTKKPKTYS